MNSVILHGAMIGEGSLVAALSVVPEGMIVPRGVMVAGSPARIRKQLGGESAAWVGRSAEHYVELAAKYLAQGIGRV
jgi:carbonic anhydrase/acetyltransferase-like protein (isoleucine patch superfamily)